MTKDTKTIDHVSLSHVDSPFDLPDNVAKNYDQCLQALKEIYPKISKLTGYTYSFSSKKLELKEKAFNRSMWLYIVGVFNELQIDINQAIGVFRSNGFVNFRTNEEFKDVQIVIPTNLVIDKDYQGVVNGNWDTIQTALNDLLAVLKKFHMMEGDK